MQRITAPSGTPSSPSHLTRHFSYQYSRKITRNDETTQQSPPQQSKPKHHPSNPSSDIKATFSFKDLGATRTVKIVVIVAVCIMGTAETIFWTQVVWRKFFGAGNEGDGPDGKATEGK